MGHKRPAPSDAGPRKKVHLDSSKGKLGKSQLKAKGRKTRFDDPPAPKRKAPITATAALKGDSDTDEEDDFEEVPQLDDELADEMDVDAEADEGDEGTSAKKPRASGNKAPGENHAAQRQAAKERRLARPHGELVLQAKAQWELARQKNISKEKRQKHVHDLGAVVKGKIKDLVTKHDASRIIQTLVKYGSQSERDQVASELSGSFIALSQSRYSKYLVLKLIRHCPSHRGSILAEFHGHVIRLLLHREATSIISDAFELYANAAERNLLIRDFYGKEVSLFDTEKVKSGGLAAVLEDADDARRSRVLRSLKENLLRIFNNPDKGAVSHPVVHRALWEYLQEIPKSGSEDDQSKARTEMFESCHELLAEMVHTKDGSRAVREFVAWGSAKDRKKILKTLKPHLEKLCMDDQAQLVLFTCLDAIDDTKTVISSVINDVVALSPKLCFPAEPEQASAGRRTLFYLLVPRDPRHFPPALIRTIAETDDVVSKTSKKDTTIRRRELLAGASPELLKFVQGNAEKLLRDPAGTLLAADIMLHAEGDKGAATTALLEPLADAPYPPPEGDKDESHPIDLPHSSRLYKTLLQGGHFSKKTQAIERSPNYSALDFARALLSSVGKEKLLAMATDGGGTFVLVEMLDTFLREGSEKEKGSLKEWLGKDKVQKAIERSKSKGKDALLAKVKQFTS